MKINREMVTRAGLVLLNQVGLEQLTLRLLAGTLHVQAPTIYWHFKNKQELLDEMATLVITEGAKQMLRAHASADWTVWVKTYGNGLRKTLLAYRDGARMVAGTRYTSAEPLKISETIAAKLVESGFSVRQAIVLLSTVLNYTQSFVMEEQAVYPVPGERSPQYDVAARAASLKEESLPLQRKAGSILFENFERRYNEGLALIVGGAHPQTGRATQA